MRLKLPHIPRIFTAVALWVLLLTLVITNIHTKTNFPLAVLTDPNSASAHENLAQTLWASGARALAAQELSIASELSPVLGIDTTAQAEREAAQIKYWQDVAVNHPDYRDAYIQLASLSYAQGNLTQTKTYLTQAAALDPNGKAVGDLLEFITKKLER